MTYNKFKFMVLSQNLKEQLKNFIKTRKSLIIDISIILLLGLLSLTWFRGSLINGGDFNYSIDWHRMLKATLSLWDETFSFGLSRPIGAWLPISLLGAFLQSLGFSTIFIEKIFFYLWFAGGGISMYFLCRVLGLRRLGRVVSSIIYMFNPFSLIIIWHISQGSIQLPYAFAPLFLAAYIFGIKNDRGLKYIIFVVTGLFLLTGSAYINPRSALMHFIPVFFYFLYFYFYEKNRRIFSIKYTFLFFLFLALLSFYWILPFVTDLKTNLDAHFPTLMSDVNSLKLTSVGLLKAVRMMGYWSMQSGYKGDPYYPYWQYFNSFWINAISWLIPILVLLGFLQKEVRRNKIYFFYLSVIIFGLFGIKGTLPPFAGLSEWIYKNFPYMTLAARFSFLLYGLPTYLIFCVMMGYGFMKIYDFGFKRIKNAIYFPLFIILVLLSVVLVFPFWNGEVIQSSGKSITSERLIIPKYWIESKKWLSDQKDFFRILPLPMSKTYNTSEFWGEGYSGSDMAYWLSEHPTLWINTKGTFRVPELIGEQIEKEISFKDVAKVLGFLNIKYVLYRLDTRWDFLRGHTGQFAHNPKKIEKFLEGQNDIALEKVIGKFSFYKVDSKYILPHIYIPNKISLVEGKVDSMIDLIKFVSPEDKEGIIFSEQNQNVFSESYLNSLTNNFIWQEPLFDESNYNPNIAVYQIKIPIDGDYEIFLRNDNFLDYRKANLIEISLDDVKIISNEFEFSDNLVKLGKRFIEKGDHRLTLLLPSAKNLVTDLSIGGTSWQSINLLLPNGIKQPITFSQISKYRLEDNYRISFDVMHIKGEQPGILIWQNDDDAPVPHWNPKIPFPQFGTADPYTNFISINLPEVGNSWQDFNLIFKSQNSLSAGLAIIGDKNDLQGIAQNSTQNLFNNVRVDKVFNNPVLLRLISSNTSEEKNINITWKKISSTKYEISVEGAESPYFLIFSEAYHPKWKISIPEATHFMANGFANGWYISRLGTYDFKISFAPQKVYLTSVIISSALILSGSLFFLINYLIHRKKDIKPS